MGDIAKNAGADTYSKPQELIGIGINAALAMVGLIFLVLMIYAGYLWLTSHGEEEPIKKAQKIIVSSIIGFILVVSAYAITVFVGKRFEVGGGGTSGETKECTPPKSGWSCQSIDVCIKNVPGSEDAPDIETKRIFCEEHPDKTCELGKCPNDPDDIVCCEVAQPAEDFVCEIICAKTDALDWSQEWKSDPISWGMKNDEDYLADVSKCAESGKCKVLKFGDQGFLVLEAECKDMFNAFDCEVEINGEE